MEDLHFRLEERDRLVEHEMKYLTFGHGTAIALVFSIVTVVLKDGGSAGWLLISAWPYVAGLLLIGGQVISSARVAAKNRHAFRPMMESFVWGRVL